MPYPRWSKEEDAIITALYPTMGMRGTTESLRQAHYIRTKEAVKERAKNLGVRRDMKTAPRVVDGAWTNEELAIVAAEYPVGGAERVMEVLRAHGYDRTVGAITTRACIIGVKMRNTKRRMRGSKGKNIQINLCMDTVLDMDVIEALSAQRNRSAYVRKLIRRDIARRNKES